MLKPLPVTAAWETVMLAVPELVSVTVWLLLLPTFTSPKLRLVGLAERSMVVPFPARDTVVGEFEALLVTVRLPVALPLVVGPKLTLKVVV